jgi:hypothetical protein
MEPVFAVVLRAPPEEEEDDLVSVVWACQEVPVTKIQIYRWFWVTKERVGEAKAMDKTGVYVEDLVDICLEVVWAEVDLLKLMKMYQQL